MSILTGVNEGLEGEVAALSVEGELVNVHPAGAGYDLIIHKLHVTPTCNGEIRTGRGLVPLCPV